MAKPKGLFRVEVKNGSPGYAERQGGTFASAATANDRKKRILRKHPDADVKVFHTACDWVEIDPENFA